MMSAKEKLDILDMIINILSSHEMKLDALTQRLESLCYHLETKLDIEDDRSTREILSGLIENTIEFNKDR